MFILTIVLCRREDTVQLSSDSSETENEDDSSSSVSETDDSEDSDPNSNEAVFGDLWKKEDRPLRYQKRSAFNALSQDTVCKMISLYNEQRKQKNSNTDTFGKTVKLKPRKFKGGKDDGYTVLHPARFLRQPYGPPKKWWKEVPLNRDQEGVCLDLPLEFVGCANNIASKTLSHLHDRSYPLQLRMLSPDNVNINTRAKKRIERMEGGELTTLNDYWWTEVDAVKRAQDCILNYCSLLQILWPQDPTGIMMMRILHKYGWIATTQDEGKRVQVISAFFDCIVKENCYRAVNGKPVLKAEEMEARLKLTLSNFGLKDDLPFLHNRAHNSTVNTGASGGSNFNNGSQFSNSGSQFSNNGSQFNSGGQHQRNRQQGNNRGGNQRSQDRKREYASYNGMGTCYQFNDPSGNRCKNKKGSSSSSCKAPNGNKDFAHVCNKFVVSKNSYCLGKHPRAEHR